MGSTPTERTIKNLSARLVVALYLCVETEGRENVKDETRQKVEAEIKDWQYPAELPSEAHGFTLSLEHRVKDDIFDIFEYENVPMHRSVYAYFHEETMEYKVRERVGLLEFCRIECIAGDVASFEGLLRTHLDSILDGLVTYDPRNLGILVQEKNIDSWDYHAMLPDALEGFTLFIRPSEPIKITNGSVIVFDYEDFDTDSNFIIYYNVFRDEFFGESRVPDISYDFDSKTIKELEEKLNRLLIPYLRKIREQAAKGEKI